MLSRSAFRLLVATGLSALVVLLALAGSSGGSVAGGVAVRIGSPPQHPAGSKVTGPLAGATRLSITITLKPRDPAGLANYASGVATPGSSIYRQYLTVAQFRQRFAPTDSEVSAVAAELRDRGLSAGQVSKNGLAIPVSGSASAVAHALSISFQRVQLPNGRVAYANTAAPQLPASVAGAIQSVIGLDSLFRAVPLGIQSPTASGQRGRVKPRVVTGGTQPCLAAVSDGTTYGAYTADQLASAYRFSNLYGAGDLGSGQTVALFELEPYLASDISAYQSCYGTSTTVSNVLVDGGAGSGAGSGEAALDIEDVMGLSPQVGIRVYEGPNTSAGVYDTYNKIVSDNVAKVISTSWGLCEANEGLTAAQSENTLFQEAATQGESTFAAAGDSGSTDCGGHTLAVDDPASQPYVTGVGGTTVSAIGPPPTQSVWNDGNSGGGGGGGISSFWTMPSYQSGAASSLNVINSNSSGSPCSAGSGNYCREVPDVSVDADEYTGYVIYYNGSWTAFGGTSAAAPLWAAFTALTNASSGCGGTPVGFVNAKLYTAAGGAYASDFSDITTGNNNLAGSGLYPAGTGYDMASGLGTPIGSGLPGGLCGVSPPVVTLTGPANGSATNNTKPSFSGTAGTATGDSSTITVKIYSGSNTSGSLVQTLTTTQSAGSWLVAPSTALADGTYTAQAEQTNTNTNVTGYSSANTFIVDTTPPTNALSLTSKSGGGSYYSGSGTTVYYQGSTAGSFKLQNVVSDPGSGPASSAFAALGGSTTGWSFTNSTVSSPAGGPYVSNAFSWTAGTTSAPIETVTGADNAGNTGQSTLSFTNDSTVPTGSISAIYDGSAVSVSFSASDNGGSDVNSAAGQLKRASATLLSGTCQTFDGFSNVGPAGVTSPYSDTSVSSSNCYEYEYVVPDNVGNQATIGPSAAVQVTSGGGNHPPVASFTFSPGSPLTGAVVSFDGTGSSDPDSTPIASYSWNFGDGTTATGATPTHVYAHSGNYTATLTVTDTGSLTGTQAQTITVGNRPPTASFSFSPASPLTGQTVSFNGTGSSDPDGTISSYAWIFGDGGTSSGATPTHAYSKPGTYTVQLSVTDDSGSVGVMARSLTASAPPSHAPTLNFRIPKQKLGSVLKRGLRFSVSSNQPASAKLQLVLGSRDAKRLRLGNGKHPVMIASVTRQLAAGKTIAITLTLTPKARNRLSKVSTIRVRITFTATGTGGKTTVSQSLLLKR